MDQREIIKKIAENYDLRHSGTELRVSRFPWGNGYRLTVNGVPVMASVNPERILDVFTASVDIGSISVVSSARHNRGRRNRSEWTHPDAMNPDNDILDADELEPVDRFMRSAEVVSDYLPDYRITVRDLFPDEFPEEPEHESIGDVSGSYPDPSAYVLDSERRAEV